MSRLVRAPLILLYAAAWGFGSYALGFVLLDGRLSVALGAAFAGGPVVGWQLGGLTGRPWPIVLGIPLACGALTVGVYALATRRMAPAGAVLAGLLVAYVLALGVLGAISEALTRRRFRRHMIR